MNKLLLHMEGLAVLALCLYFYGQNDFSWLLFIVLLFAPDVSALGYLLNNKQGALIYNIVHTYTVSLGVAACGILLSVPTLLAVGLIWTAHIGMDRLVGYGLKYPTEFKDTHLNRV